MLSKIIEFSLKSKFFIILILSFIVGFGIYSLNHISVGAVPDITNNQVQVITTSRSLSTIDVEQFITYPVELEMSNLPGVKEIRSVSKFGLSVVTVIFENDMGTYLPRQLIAEKLSKVEKNIPKHFGTPEMGPITTGLGEIYQYTLETKPGYEYEFSVMELRSIQDWIVKRQLSGIPGIVEINTWGGFLKEYEVAISSEKLQARNISIQQVFTALEKNNSIAGGSYIEKEEQAYFIRGNGLVKSLEDIRNISVENRHGTPILIGDIAEVGFGFARRFGAITGNGEGEKVLGQIMMLKDADSKQVIDAVKDRLQQIEKSLPEGVYINGFLDRSELIGKTTSTVAENLFLGFLVVAFIVTLLIGDLRSGLIISSVIPLSFLIAISLMYIFNIDANLMSLGALDFGIIIDGAVIIVEFVAFKMLQKSEKFKSLTGASYTSEKDRISLKGASKMMNSAIFGQLIILIVFIPIVTLSGVEGKMFRPMALTFGFALLGAMFLCLTWIPVACSLFLNPKQLKARNLSTRFLNQVKKVYIPSVRWALDHTKLVVISALAIVVLAVFTFTKMGGEFVPTLDEGDFVIQPILKTGKSLSSTIERTTDIEKILLDNFPEVTQVVSRIGAAEVPTDPMSMQDSDVIIRLKPKNEWTSAQTKEELAEKFKEALAIIPGMDIEFTQPIEMRFNELITGVRSDIAIKIFGDDLNILAQKGNEIQRLINDVDGAADISVEKIVGLPQMAVNFNRSKIARYGLNIEDLNNIISAGFAGQKTGVVFEGEKRFDMVVRLQEDKRRDISDLQNLIIDTPNGGKIPLSEVADISYSKGPAKISRDETKRRIVVGVNVRNRDLASVVEDIQGILNDNLSLPVGYTLTYGGQFENLQSATKRLQITVPIVLVLIFVLLYFALRDYKDALLIFTAIPFSAVGGVFLLWIRDMPFSISAGVGFIALFGIAVLNGIILVEYFKDLQNDNKELNKDNIIEATQDRLRAVLLTASSTALGFLPMAISTGAGAEVQRPLATVVIGGLITSTLLTLIILPVLYYIFEGKSKSIKMPKTTILVIFLGLGGIFSSQAQNPELNQLKTEMLDNNRGLNASQLNINRAEAAEGQAFTFNKAQIYQNYDEAEADPIANRPLYQWGIIQNFDFPTVYNSRLKLNKVTTELAATSYSIEERMKLKNLEISYMQYSIIKERLQIYKYLDSIYKDFSRMASRKFEEGESTYLEKITAQSKQKQVEAQLVKVRSQLVNTSNQIRSFVQSDVELSIEGETPHRFTLDNLNGVENLPDFVLSELQTQQAKRSEQLAKNELLPGISASYFMRSNSSIDKNFEGYQIGLNIPLLFFGNRSKIKARQLENEMMAVAQEETKIQLEQKQKALINSLSSQDQSLATFEDGQLKVADEIFKTANLSFKNGEIDFFRFIQSLETAQQIKLEYLQQLMDFNAIVISLNYLTLN
ncbi:CusA/CzcA family heavy metal efflux RND transporter [Psychroflexus montanilacus]|uniref:CusA/CzcA family heavy metal efflux RND transporter n=1 Tax=Psychroflexus montanilacus TaxID=2873598 RepID=UPI001CCD0D2B|nr:CusA/CzcA family heavy metal efflux RND transporter [Psychroflexus montanilacus]MBZ9651208.1 CusA/CzcA family heavy metal efflux RND transporter [Psychroflexus montanilacus]